MNEKRTTILVIDDDEPILTLMENVLRAYRYEPVIARSGAAAVEVARSSRPDLILLDMHMPEMSGRQVLDLLRSDELLRSIPVVILSGDRMNSAEVAAAGAVGAIQKPFDIPDLIAEIEERVR
jgi:Response regulator containing CheY-like receiver, AAA-type ATPase, and DNA-binding domains